MLDTLVQFDIYEAIFQLYTPPNTLIYCNHGEKNDEFPSSIFSTSVLYAGKIFLRSTREEHREIDISFLIGK